MLSSHLCKAELTPRRCGSAFILFGYDQGVMGGLLTGPHWVAQFPEIGEILAWNRNEDFSNHHYGQIPIQAGLDLLHSRVQ